jgi:dephospho-CoA kinase
MKRIIKEYLPLKTFSYGLVKGLYSKEKQIYFIGIYDNSIFCGTDKLSMAVQPDFIKLLDIKKNATFVFEGDRLFNQSLFDQKPCDIYVLEVNNENLKERHKTRNDNQTEQFKKAKHTKIQNIKEKNQITILPNNSKEETKQCFNTILNAIENAQN